MWLEAPADPVAAVLARGAAAHTRAVLCPQAAPGMISHRLGRLSISESFLMSRVMIGVSCLNRRLPEVNVRSQSRAAELRLSPSIALLRGGVFNSCRRGQTFPRDGRMLQVPTGARATRARADCASIVCIRSLGICVAKRSCPQRARYNPAISF